MIHFKKLEEKAVLHNPLKDFEIDSQPIEYREDPNGIVLLFCLIKKGF